MSEPAVVNIEVEKMKAEIARLKTVIAGYEEDLARAYSSVLNHFCGIGVVYNEAVEKAKSIFKK